MTDQPIQPRDLNASKRTLTCANIPVLDNGIVARAFDNAVRLGTLDIIDRPMDKTPRKIHLILELRPITTKDTGVLEGIDDQFVVKKGFPVQRSRFYPMLVTKDGQMVFDIGSPTDPHQNTFTYEPTASTPPEEVDTASGEVLDDTEEEEGPMPT